MLHLISSEEILLGKPHSSNDIENGDTILYDPETEINGYSLSEIEIAEATLHDVVIQGLTIVTGIEDDVCLFVGLV